MAQEEGIGAPKGIIAKGLSVGLFAMQMSEYKSAPLNWEVPILVRGEHGDSYLAAIHVDNGQLILDVGGPVDVDDHARG